MTVAERWIADTFVGVDTTALTRSRAKAVADFLLHFGEQFGASASAYYRSDRLHADAIAIVVQVDRPQRRVVEIGRSELLLLVFPEDSVAPSIFSLRDDFPFTPHQNSVPEDWPYSLCVDDRPWAEAKASWSPSSFIQRIRSWLTNAAMGRLHHPAQALEPLFYGSGRAIVLPRDAISADTADNLKRIIGFIDSSPDANTQLIHTKEIEQFTGRNTPGRIVMLPIELPVQLMTGMRRVPRSYRSLVTFLAQYGIDLPGRIGDQVLSWSAWSSGNTDLLTGQLAICLLSNVTDGERNLSDVRVLLFPGTTAGDFGVGLGRLGQDPKTKRYARLVGVSPVEIFDAEVVPLDVILDFDRQLAADASGAATSCIEKVALIGAGAIGSYIATGLCKRGAYVWSIFDMDTLLPHNLARHALPNTYIGIRKAPALAHYIQATLSDQNAASGFYVDVLHSQESWPDAARLAFNEASAILDASASVAVARKLSDATAAGRRASVFLNPKGTAAVYLGEDSARSITLRDLEAQYYEHLLLEDELKDHLSAGPDGIAYSGSCRTLSSRIPGSALSALSGLMDPVISSHLASNNATICIKSIKDDGSVAVHQLVGRPIRRVEIAGWIIVISESLEESFARERLNHLPNETGGVLLGIIDHEVRSIHVVGFLSAPPDSEETEIGFERGVQGLELAIKKSCELVMGQAQYIGEWHSHPEGATTNPSGTDLKQIAWLALNLHVDGCPAVVAIVGDQGINLMGGRAITF